MKLELYEDLLVSAVPFYPSLQVLEDHAAPQLGSPRCSYLCACSILVYWITVADDRCEFDLIGGSLIEVS